MSFIHLLKNLKGVIILKSDVNKKQSHVQDYAHEKHKPKSDFDQSV